MRVLLIKTSSLGDLIHSFPALSDARQQWPDIQFDWLVEEGFSQVPAWHPAVKEVIPIGLRRWRKHPIRHWHSGEIPAFFRGLRQRQYDLAIDAQGLLKSALPGLLAPCPLAGYDRHSIREPLAALCYSRKFSVPKQQHAIERVRHLLAQVLGYPQPDSAPSYGIEPPASLEKGNPPSAYLLFLHATTWPSKHWPETFWVKLADLAIAAGYRILWPWHTPEERLRAERFITAAGGSLAPRLDLNGMASLLAGAHGVVGVDSGLSHLATALERPNITLYGPTSSALTGAMGRHQTSLSSTYECAPCLSRQCHQAAAYERPTGPGTNNPLDPLIHPPCFAEITPELVFQQLSQRMEEASL
jgi:heptosyltransferase-1